VNVTAHNLFVLDRNSGRMNVTSDESAGISVVAEIMGAALGIGKGKCSTASLAASPARSLQVVRCAWRNIPHQYHLKAAEIHPEFKCSRTAEQIYLSSRKTILDLTCLIGPPLRSMLLGPQGNRLHV